MCRPSHVVPQASERGRWLVGPRCAGNAQPGPCVWIIWSLNEAADTREAIAVSVPMPRLRDPRTADTAGVIPLRRRVVIAVAPATPPGPASNAATSQRGAGPPRRGATASSCGHNPRVDTGAAGKVLRPGLLRRDANPAKLGNPRLSRGRSHPKRSGEVGENERRDRLAHVRQAYAHGSAGCGVIRLGPRASVLRGPVPRTSQASPSSTAGFDVVVWLNW